MQVTWSDGEKEELQTDGDDNDQTNNFVAFIMKFTLEVEISESKSDDSIDEDNSNFESEL